MGRVRKSKPKTPEQVWNLISSLATNLAIKKLEDGTASSQLICQVLSLTSEEQKLKLEKMEAEVELSKAKIKQLEASSASGELYKKAIEAFQRYSGREVEEVNDFDEWDE